MRYSDLVRHSVIDILSTLTAEGVYSVSFETLMKTLNNQDLDVDRATLFTLVDTLPIVNTVKDDVVHFNKAESPNDENPEKDANKVDKLARKQVNKELNK